MFSVVHMVSRVVIAVVTRVGIVRVRSVVVVRIGGVGRIGLWCVRAVALPAGARAVLPVRTVLSVLAAVHDSACPTRPPAHLHLEPSNILDAHRTATSPHSYLFYSATNLTRSSPSSSL